MSKDPPQIVATRRLRGALRGLQKELCGYCFERFRSNRMWIDPANPGAGSVHAPLRATIDHVVPVKAGGLNSRNSVLVHNRCNHRKGSRAPTGCELIVLEWVNALCDQPDSENAAKARRAMADLDSLPPRPKMCGCGECRDLDIRYPKEGRQWALPLFRHPGVRRAPRPRIEQC